MPKLSIDDWREINDVLLRYATGIDQRDWPLFQTCFADDFEADYGLFGKFVGPDSVTEAMIAAHLPFGATMHRLTNIVASSADAGASARSYVDAVLMPQKDGDPVTHATGIYDDLLIKRNGEWRIRHRHYTMVRLRQIEGEALPKWNVA